MTVLLFLACSGSPEDTGTSHLAGLVAAALESDGEIVFLDAATADEAFRVSIVEHEADMPMAHNVQGSPDGSLVWVTVVPMHMGQDVVPDDELVAISIADRAVVARIPLGQERHAAHVVLRDTTAYVSATDADERGQET